MAATVTVQRPTHKQIEQFLAQRRFAMVGVSREAKDFTRTLFREFVGREYDVVPVNPAVQEIDGRRCYSSVREIEPAVGAVLLLTSPAATKTIVRECADAGVKQVWMYRAAGAGAIDPEAVTFCRERGIDVIEGECPFMFLPKTGFPHRVHGLILKICGKYPK